MMEMRGFATSEIINAPLDHVFALLVDPRHQRHWMDLADLKLQPCPFTSTTSSTTTTTSATSLSPTSKRGEPTMRELTPAGCRRHASLDLTKAPPSPTKREMRDLQEQLYPSRSSVDGLPRPGTRMTRTPSRPKSSLLLSGLGGAETVTVEHLVPNRRVSYLSLIRHAGGLVEVARVRHVWHVERIYNSRRGRGNGDAEEEDDGDDIHG
ncbi:hypothetical protein HK101_009014, partial [Irineochytrium annulatum]